MDCAACIWVGRAQDHRVELRQRQAVGEVGGHMADAVFAGDFPGLVELAADQRDDFDAIDVLDAVEMLDAEGAGAGQRDFDGPGHELVLSSNSQE